MTLLLHCFLPLLYATCFHLQSFSAAKLMAGTELWEHAQAGWEEGFAEAKKREKEEHKQQMLKRIEEDQKVLLLV